MSFERTMPAFRRQHSAAAAAAATPPRRCRDDAAARACRTIENGLRLFEFRFPLGRCTLCDAFVRMSLTHWSAPARGQSTQELKNGTTPPPESKHFDPSSVNKILVHSDQVMFATGCPFQVCSCIRPSSTQASSSSGFAVAAAASSSSSSGFAVAPRTVRWRAAAGSAAAARRSHVLRAIRRGSAAGRCEL